MLAIDPDRLQVYRNSALERQRQIQEQIQARRDRAWEIAKNAAEILHRDFQAGKVVVFGSLVQAELFHQHSDVDLAVWDLNERLYFRAVGYLQSLDPLISVDLIPFDEAKPALQEAIQRDGVEL